VLTSRDSRHYQPFEQSFTADKGGIHEFRAVMVEVKGAAFGSAWTVPDLGMEFMPVESGRFQMGSNDGDSDEKPVHRVTLTQNFWMGKYEVTQGEYEKLMGSNPSYFKGQRNPVEKVSWHDAVKFCEKLTETEHKAGRLPSGYEYRLPTEAEWEYSCRSGTTGKYAGDLDSMGWYRENSGKKTHEVGRKKSNAWGLFDMHGNVWEWCFDWMGSYPSSSVTDPTGSNSGSHRVLRGGGWYDDAGHCRSAFRGSNAPSNSNDYVGFRVALAPVQQK